MAGIRFTIKMNRLRKSLLQGMRLEERGCFVSQGEGSHTVIFPMLDSGIDECPWGRLRCRLHLPENTMCYLYAAAANGKPDWDGMLDAAVDISEKKRFMRANGGLRFINRGDVLLYQITGRYLWIMAEVLGEGVSLSDVVVWAPGDNFMQTFPEVYQEKDSFFHRYLSIFSSIYNDFQDELDRRELLLDIDRAPARLLELYARWMGIDLEGGFLEEDILRRFVREAGELIRRKGTAWSMERICELLLNEKPVIVERELMQRYTRRQEQQVYSKLYGESPYDVSLLISGYVSERRREQLLHLLHQFKPLRCRLHIVFLEKSSVLDGHSYLDKNAVIFQQGSGALDEAQVADGTVILE